MRVALIQADPIVGELEANARALISSLREAHAAGASLAVTPEMAVCGYPARDLLSRGDFVARCMESVGRIARSECGAMPTRASEGRARAACAWE